MLFYACPRRDTNEFAHLLISQFGSISNVFDAPYEELVKVKGIGENGAALIKLMPALFRIYEVDAARKQTQPLNSTDAIGNYLKGFFNGVREEAVYILLLDNCFKPLSCELIMKGSINAAEVSIRKIITTALKFNANHVVIAHNHPSGVALPSEEDIYTTSKIFDALAFVNVKLLDHIIIAVDDFVSFRDSGIVYEKY